MQIPVNNEDLLNIRHEVNTTLLPEVLKRIQDISQDPSNPYASIDTLQVKKAIAGLGAIGVLDKLEDISKEEYIKSSYSANDLVYSNENSLLSSQGLVIQTFKGLGYTSVKSLANFKLVNDNQKLTLIENISDVTKPVETKAATYPDTNNLDIIKSAQANNNYWSTGNIDKLASTNYETAKQFTKRYVAFDVSNVFTQTTNSINFSPVSITLSDWIAKINKTTDWTTIWGEMAKDLLSTATDVLSMLTTKLPVAQVTVNALDDVIKRKPYSTNIQAYINDSTSKSDTFRNEVIGRLLACGPDFFSNMFDVYIIPKVNPFTSLSKDNADGKMQSLITKAISGNSKLSDIITPESFNVRTSSIDIPLPKLKTISYKVCQRVVKVPSNRLACEFKGTLELDMDARLYYHTFMSSLSFNNAMVESSNNEALGKSNFIDLAKTSFKSFHNIVSTQNVGIDIVILPLSYGTLNSSVKGNNILIYLSDVKFLGYGGGLGYNKSPTQGKAKYPFIYKDIRIIKNS